MKRVLIFFIMLLTSCRSNTDLLYYKLVDQLKEVNISSLDIPFSIDISVEKLTDMELIYHVIIDEPKIDAKDVSVLVIHDIETENIFPSLGIIDDKVDLLINNENNSIKGIALVGYLPIDIETEINFKLRIEYKDDQKNKNIDYYLYKTTLIDIE